MPEKSYYGSVLWSNLPKKRDSLKAGFFIRISTRTSADSFTSKDTKHNIHWHDHVHIWYTISGEYCNSAYGRENWLSDGGLLIIPPFVPHTTGGKPGQPCTVVCLDTSVDFIRRIVPPEKQHAFLNPAPRNYSPADLHLTGADREYATAFFKKLCCEAEKDYNRAAVLMKDEIREFFIFLANTVSGHSDSSTQEDESSALIHLAIDYVYKHFSEPIHLEDLCRVTALSRAMFCKLFKSCTGNTFSEFLNSTRISNASNMLLNTDLPVHEIMERCGFHTKSNFIRLFRRNFYYSPRELRKLYKDSV